MSIETWKPIPGWEGFYSVSDQGRVRRDARGPGTRPGFILKQRAERRGYLTVSPVRPGVKQRPMLVHRLVLLAFKGAPPTEGHEANHINGVKTDNRPSNLEWATRAENMSHAYGTGLHGRYIGSNASAAKLTEDQVGEILRLVAGRAYRKDIARQFGVSTKMVDEIVSGAHWKHVPRPDLSKKRRGRHVLTEADAREIKGLLRTGGLSHAAIGERFGVSGPTVWQIAAGRTWKHVE